MAETVVVVTWDDMARAGEALKRAKELDKQKMIELKDGVVVVKDEAGKVKVHRYGDITTGGGAVSGGLVGLVIGTILGGPIGGLALGAAAGAFAGKKIDLGFPEDQVQAVADKLTGGSSAAFLHLTSGKQEFVEAAVKQSGGHIVEFSVSDEASQEVEDSLAAYTGHIVQ